MTEKITKIRWMIFFVSLATGLFAAPVSLCKTVKDSDSIATLEKSMLASSTRTIQYREGKTKSISYKKWYKAKKIALSSKKLTIRKKGWYTILVTTKTGKRKVTPVYFEKQTYQIPCNNIVKLSAGWCYVEPKGSSAKSLEVKKASLTSGSNISVWEKGNAASRIWKIVPAKGKTFRLKNANSKLYLGMKKNGEKAVQVAYSKKDKGQIFRAYKAGNYVYLRCEATKKYLQWTGSSVQYSKRKRQKAWMWKLAETPRPLPGLYITDGIYPQAIQEEASFSIGGKIYSRFTMKTLQVCVVNTSGKVVLSKVVKPQSTSYSIKKVDADITFGKLAVGNYFYQIIVKDTSGRTTIVKNQPFVVTAVSSTLNSSSNLGKTKTLSYNSNLIAAVGHQSTGSSLEKKACASFALAYCNAILYGSAPSPHSYWLSERDVSCVWSKGGYTCSATGYGSQANVLQTAYMQLASGKPCILNVKSSTSAEHWICLVGYKDVTNIKNLTAANFLAIDPWDGALITVSNKYSVKNTYRLGVKS